MPTASSNGIKIEYETAGDPSGPPLLLVMGLGAQLIAWDDEFVGALAERGFYVVRYDNRDTGRSTWFDEAGMPNISAAMSGGALEPAYLLSDMADDAAGLLDALGIESAHVLGASMGGMIAQSVAINHPERVRTLTSIMSTTGDRKAGAPHPEALSVLAAPSPSSREEAVELGVKASKVIGSPGFPFHEDRVRASSGAAYDRAFHPAGFARQLVAILASPDRTPALRSLKVPTLVIHGEADNLVDPSGGRATAEAIPGAELWLVPGMGHGLPLELHKEIVDRVAAHCGVS